MSDEILHSTRASATFHRHSGPPITLSAGSGRGEVAEIVGMATSKHFGEAAGTFTLTLKRSKGRQSSFLSQFADPENNWVHLKWLVNGRSYEATWGLTDSMTENVKRAPDGARTEVITVTGRDFGKVFETSDLFINIYERGNVLPMFPLYRAVHESLIGSPDTIVKTLVRSWLGNAEATGPTTSDKPWQLPGSIFGDASRRFFFDWLSLDHVRRTRGQAIVPSLYSPDQQGKLWDSMQEYSNGCLNEMWCDLAMGRDNRMRPSVIMRERPFPTIKSSDRWRSLPTKHLKPENISERDVVSDGNGRFNYWSLRLLTLAGSGFSTGALVQSAGNRSPGQPGSVPIYDLDSIRKHGVRRYEQSTRYTPVDEASQFAGQDGGPHWLRIVTQWQRIIHDWYVIAPQQFTGSMTLTTLDPEIRLGWRITEERPESDGYSSETWEYYVEGIENHWQYGSHGSTHLILTRGQPVNANLLQQQYRRYVSVDVDSLSGDEIDAVAEAGALAQVQAATLTSAEAGAGPAADSQETTEPEADAPVQSDGIASDADPGEEADVSDADFVPIEGTFTITTRAAGGRSGGLRAARGRWGGGGRQ